MAAGDFAAQNGTEKIATNALTTVNGVNIAADLVEVQRIKIGYGADGDFNDVSSAAPLPISGAVTGAFFPATQAVSGTVAVSNMVAQGLTDTQLRAAAVPVSGAFFQATQPVSGTVAVSNMVAQGLTDAQLRLTAVPVSAASLPLPTGAGTEATLAGVRTDLGTDGTTPPAVLGAGTGVRGWLRSIYEKLTGTIAVTGTFWQATQPVSGAFFQVTQPVSIATNTPDVTDRAARALGTIANTSFAVTNAGTFAVQSAATLAAETTKVIGTVNVAAGQTVGLVAGAAVIGALTANQSVNTAQIAGVATAVGSGISGTGVQRVVMATDVPLPALSEMRSATLHVTGTAAANTALTVTLPAVAGQFHYITNIHLTRNATAALAGTATLVHTSTNLPGSPAWSVGNAMSAGGSQLDLNYTATTPLRSAVVNTATTITMPAAGLAVLNRINISYFTAA